jgi:hypothetical protein
MVWADGNKASEVAKLSKKIDLLLSFVLFSIGIFVDCIFR